MTTKTAEKKPPREEPRATHSADEMRAAYECHTLAQILYSQIAATRPWLVQMPAAPDRTVSGPGVAHWPPRSTWQGLF